MKLLIYLVTRRPQFIIFLAVVSLLTDIFLVFHLYELKHETTIQAALNGTIVNTTEDYVLAYFQSFL